MQFMIGSLLAIFAFVLCSAAFSAPYTSEHVLNPTSTDDWEDPVIQSPTADPQNSLLLHVLDPTIMRLGCAACH